MCDFFNDRLVIYCLLYLNTEDLICFQRCLKTSLSPLLAARLSHSTCLTKHIISTALFIILVEHFTRIFVDISFDNRLNPSLGYRYMKMFNETCPKIQVVKMINVKQLVGVEQLRSSLENVYYK